MNNKEIGLRLKKLREDRGLHQKEVAAVLGIVQSAYCDRENGHTAFTAVELDRLAEFHGKTLDDLLHADRSVLNMHEHSSHGYIDNVIHAQNINGVSEDTVKKLFDLFATAMTALEKISEQQTKVIELLSKKS